LLGFGVGLGLLSLGWSGPAQAEGAVQCDTVTFDVALAPDQPQVFQLSGELCSRGEIDRRTVQVLVHGATYNHTYWDWPQHPELYSYVHYATAAGFATLALDRLGDGQSDRPDGFALTSDVSAYTIHQVIQAVRSGTLSTIHFSHVHPKKVILVGHSFGSDMCAAEISEFQDVDGFINTGFLHNVGPGQTNSANLLYPVQFDPAFAALNYPEGYLTTVPGARGQLFYNPADADPAVIALDEQTKDTVTVGEFSDLGPLEADTLNIHVPTLVVVGDNDALFCTPPTCTQTNSLAQEPNFYPPDAHLVTLVIPKSGHDLNLHQNAFEWFIASQIWADITIGTR
jgi:pimeloyl-ACP methyl ester carboxylesterase